MVYEFGHGLSYVDFAYTWGSESHATQIQYGITDELTVLLDIVVKNIDAALSGQEVVMVFVIPPSEVTIDGAPAKQLRFFDKISLHPQESTTVSVRLTSRDFSLADSEGQVNVIHGLWTVCAGSLTTTVLI